MSIEWNSDWYSRVDSLAFSWEKPGIYEWRIAGLGLYVGKTRGRLKTRIGHYPNNVRKMLNGLPWRKGSGRPFRDIHVALRVGYETGAAITVSVLENCHPDRCLELERNWIALRRREEMVGGMRVLNRA